MMHLNRRELLLAVAATVSEGSPRKDLLSRWQATARLADGTVGIATLHLDQPGHITAFNGNERFPLASVCKVPIAMHILALVDEGKLSLDQDIEVLPRDVMAGVSDIARQWPRQQTFRIGELIQLMVARSDNTAEEALFRIGGGGLAITEHLRQWNIRGVRVDRSERHRTLDVNGVKHYPPPEQWTDAGFAQLINAIPPDVRYASIRKSLKDPRDTGTPNATVTMFARLFRGEALSRISTAFLIDVLKSTITFPTRLKGALPFGTVVAHKTGADATVNSFSAATNDSGVIFLPNGGRLAISVYVKASTRSDAERDDVIAQSALAAFDAYQAT